MNKRIYLYTVLPALLFAGTAQAEYPLMNIVADRIIEKYQQANCEQLWQQKARRRRTRKRKDPEMLQDDPQMRTAFIDKVAGPVVNKMFECGMIP